jgi:hypothetical protein
MIISRKFAFIIAGILTIQATQAFYDSSALKTEVAQILNFIANELSQHATSPAKKVAKWLKKGLDNGCQVINGPRLTNNDIIAISNTISAHTTIDAKLTVIGQMMAEKAQEEFAQYQKTTEKDKEWINIYEDDSKSHIKQLKKCGRDNLENGIVLGVCGTVIGFLVANHVALLIQIAIEKHDDNLVQQIATRLGHVNHSTHWLLR